MRVVQFGDTIVIGPEPTPEERARSVRESTEALARLMPHLVTPGVKIRRKPGVPLYYANKYRSGTVIREVDGRKDVGLLKDDGTWYPIADKLPLASLGSTCSDKTPQPHQVPNVCNATTVKEGCDAPAARSGLDIRADLTDQIVELLGGAGIVQPLPVTALDVHDSLMEGLPLRSVAYLTERVSILRDPHVFEVAVGMSQHAFRRCKQEGTVKLNTQQSARIWTFVKVLIKSKDVFGSQEDAEQWAIRPTLGLEQRRPIDLLSTPAGVELVDAFLTRVAFGVYA